MDNLMKIGEMSKMFGVSIETLRHYDRIGLLKPKIDPDNNYRYYAPEDIFFLKIIFLAKIAKIPLASVKDYLNSERIGDYLTMIRDMNERISEQERLIQSQKAYASHQLEVIAEITSFKNDLSFSAVCVEEIKKLIYIISLKDLGTIRVYPNTLEADAGIEQWTLYDCRKGFSTSTPHNDSKQYFSYLDSPHVTVFEDELKKMIAGNKATTFQMQGRYGRVKFWGGQKELSDYTNLIFHHFDLRPDVLLPIHYLFSLPHRNLEHEHFVEIYIPV